MSKETTTRAAKPAPEAQPQGLAARSAALGLIASVQEGKLLPELTRDLEPLAPGARAEAQRLALDTLRWADRADRMLGPYLRLKPREAVLNILRLGVVELCQCGGAPHGVINACVELSKTGAKGSKAPGLVNAVLRRVAKDRAKWQSLPAPRLPKPLRGPLVKRYGKAAVEAMEVAHAKGAPVDLTPRGRAPGDMRSFEALQGAWLPTGSFRLTEAGQVSALPGFAEGAWWVQDAAAALPALVLAPEPGERVLDMCAAPGGKTLQLASMGAAVTALDLSERRMARVAENLARVGLTADAVIADALSFEAPGFDAVLLDAPCSATGTIRRHPDLPIAKAKLDFDALIDLQAKMLDRAVALLKPGGRLVYCTCSLLPEEGEAQVTAALDRHPGLKPLPIALPGVPSDWVGPEGLRLRPDYWPDLGGMDGFFIAAFQRPRDSSG